MKRAALIMGLLMIVISIRAQSSLSIDECYTLARQNYPLIQQHELLLKSKAYSLATIAKGYLPQVSINGQATYQSDVTEVPIRLPGVDVPSISKDQYKLYGEVSKSLYDGGLLRNQKATVESNAQIEESKLEVELYKLKERINQLYFGILMIDEQLKQSEIVKKDIQLGLARINGSIEQGAALKSSADILKVELLKANQRSIELKSSREAFVSMLTLFINQPISEATEFVRPANPVITEEIKRPELLLFKSQLGLIDVQKQSIRSRSMPKIGLFVQGGYGRPALNMLRNEFDFYYIGGVRLTWSLSGLYTRNRENAILDINRNLIYVHQKTFLFNTNFSLKQQQSEVTKLQELVKTDDEIITLRMRIKSTALPQMENGVIGTSDYLREVNAEDQARQTHLLHEIQLLMAQYNQQSTSGNL